MPAPLKLDAALKRRLLILLREGHNVTTAVLLLNDPAKLAARGWPLVPITRRGVYKHRERHPEFKRDMEEAELHQLDLAKAALFKNVMSGNVQAQMFYLRNKARDEFPDVRDIRADVTLSLEALVTESYDADDDKKAKP